MGGIRKSLKRQILEQYSSDEKYRPKKPGRPQVDHTHCPHGHELTPENTYLNRKPNTGTLVKKCKICVSEGNKRGYAKWKSAMTTSIPSQERKDAGS